MLGDSSEYGLEQPEVIALCVLYSLHFIILAAGAGTRYCLYKDVGLYSLDVPRPTRYWVKIGLHAAMWLVLLTQMILSIIWCEENSQKYLWVLRVIFLSLEICEWVISALLMLFEYRRALGHKWYTHPLFVWSGVFIYTVEIVM